MIIKQLSSNDTGETGAHQAGILVPKDKDILEFFPKLTHREKNPRVVIELTDDNGDKWNFTFIYYNNKFFGGTRNEFRLTGMTQYIKSNNLKSRDEIIFDQNGKGYTITFRKTNKKPNNNVLKLSNSWITVKIK